ncbi:MAG: glycosyltransferase family 4 protein, partial [Bacteroidales bacterium]|nr:glycosyltransferase family 4 protein [Bacteroidales bacterium]
LIRRQFPALSARLCTIANFVDVDYFTPGEAPGGPVAQSECRSILVTARLCRRKNALGLIRAAAMLKERGHRFRIDWWGVIRENTYYNKCKKTIARWGLEDFFVLHPATTGVRELYRSADFFCLPSFYEGTSNSLAEALSCGKPVVCSAVSDNPRYVKAGENGFLFDPSDTASIADALEQALTAEEEVLARMGRASREIAFTQLHPDRFARAYQELIENWQ